MSIGKIIVRTLETGVKLNHKLATRVARPSLKGLKMAEDVMGETAKRSNNPLFQAVHQVIKKMNAVDSIPPRVSVVVDNLTLGLEKVVKDLVKK